MYRIEVKSPISVIVTHICKVAYISMSVNVTYHVPMYTFLFLRTTLDNDLIIKF